MLNRIDVINEVGSLAISLPVSEFDHRAPYVVKDVDGLDPVTASIFTLTDTGVDGDRYQGSRVDSRNIVLKLGYSPIYSGSLGVGRLRTRLFNALPPKGGVTLKFYTTDLPNLVIKGYVETHDTNMFSEEPEVSISIMCPDPYFKAESQEEIVGKSNQWVYVPSIGNGQSGFEFVSDSLKYSASNFKVYTDGDIKAYFDGDFRVGDKPMLSTISGSKYARNKRVNLELEILDSLKYGGLNMALDSRFRRVRYDIPGNNINFIIRYTPSYVGL